VGGYLRTFTLHSCSPLCVRGELAACSAVEWGCGLRGELVSTAKRRHCTPRHPLPLVQQGTQKLLDLPAPAADHASNSAAPVPGPPWADGMNFSREQRPRWNARAARAIPCPGLWTVRCQGPVALAQPRRAPLPPPPPSRARPAFDTSSPCKWHG
jgi:hypothetical protein